MIQPNALTDDQTMSLPDHLVNFSILRKPRFTILKSEKTMNRNTDHA